jgi:hypothetical protein
MSGKHLLLAALLALGVLVGDAAAAHPRSHSMINVGEFSNESSSGQAATGAEISVSQSGTQSPRAGSGSVDTGSSGGSAPPADQVVVPTLSSDSPLLENPAPAGPGTLWYQGPAGESCIYIPDASPDCYALVSAGGSNGPDVAGMASELAGELDLGLGGIAASPPASSDGLTGAQTWFWLAPGAGGQQLSLTLDGETVVVSADASQITWGFGDGATLAAGPGVPYQDGAVPADAVTHLYQTRCLPGDQGHDPYVLASCGADGYVVTASTTWAISFTATGPVSESGQLPSQTSQSELVYPVSEVRSFLNGGPS